MMGKKLETTPPILRNWLMMHHLIMGGCPTKHLPCMYLSIYMLLQTNTNSWKQILPAKNMRIGRTIINWYKPNATRCQDKDHRECCTWVMLEAMCSCCREEEVSVSGGDSNFSREGIPLLPTSSSMFSCCSFTETAGRRRIYSVSCVALHRRL